MEISFATEALKEACLARNPNAGDLPRGVLHALQVLYNAMRNAEHLGELPIGQPNPAELDDGLEWRADLADGYGVILRIHHANPPLKNDEIDFMRVYRVHVRAIETPDA